MHSYQFPAGEHTMFSTKLLHGEECMVTNGRIITISPEEFHQVPLSEVNRVTGHVEAYLPWVAWARFFPVRVYRQSTERLDPELVLECTSRQDMLALVNIIERNALLTGHQGHAASSKEQVIHDDVRSHCSDHSQPVSSVDASALHIACTRI